MKLRSMIWAMFSIFTLALAGCGGGGGGGAAPASGTVVSGVASKGLVNGATVKVFEIISSHNPAKARVATTALGQATTGTDGFYAINIGNVTNKSLVVEVTNGSYRDEATGQTKTLVSEFPSGLRAAFGNISGVVKRTGGMSVNVTPFTEMAYRDATTAGAQPNNTTIAAANAKIATAFFGSPSFDIVQTRPVDIASAVSYAAGSADQKSYATQLATLSQHQVAVGGGQTLDTIAIALLGGIDVNNQLPPATRTALDDATFKFLVVNPLNTNTATKDPNAPGANPNLPATVAVTAPTTGAIGATGVTVTATVNKKDVTAVPDGTPVTFAITSGNGSLSAASALTTGGVATVTLSANVTNVVAVAATAGAVTGTATVSFTDPNAPAAMTLTAAPTTAITGSAVTITADVTRAAGGNVPDGTTVSFSVAGGGSIPASAVTTAGRAQVTLTAGAAAGTAVVTATAGSIVRTVNVSVVTQPTKAIVKLQTTGTLAAGVLIGGVDVTLAYPQAKVSIVDAGVTASGVAATNTLLVPNVTVAGQARAALVNAQPGFGVGEFATFSFDVIPGNLPVLADFAIANASVTSVNGAILNNPVSILSLTFQ